MPPFLFAPWAPERSLLPYDRFVKGQNLARKAALRPSPEFRPAKFGFRAFAAYETTLLSFTKVLGLRWMVWKITQ